MYIKLTKIVKIEKDLTSEDIKSLYSDFSSLELPERYDVVQEQNRYPVLTTSIDD